VRTNCEGKDAEEISNEIGRLVAVQRAVMERALYAKPPEIIYRENTLLNDLLSDDLDEILVEGNCDGVRAAVSINMPSFADKVICYDTEAEGRGLFDAFNLPHQIEKALRKVVRLPCGGFVTIEQTEACAVADVNTGQFTGKKNYRETILQTNLEAAGVLAEQVILRNLSGIIIVDFIDMKSAEDRKVLTRAVEQAFKKDRVGTEIIGMTELGLMQLTRKKTREPLDRLLSKKCPHCGGTGYVNK
jgi:ribonuclease G